MPKGKKETDKEPEKEVTPSETEAVSKIEDIADLAGVGGVTEGKLREAGYETIESIAIANHTDLQALDISAEQAEKIIKAARLQIDQVGVHFGSAFDLMKRQTEMKLLTTGVKSLDELIGGGLERGRLYEVWGEEGCGKTNLCMQICVTALLPTEQGGLGSGGVLFIDTEGSFWSPRVGKIAERFGLDPNETLKKILVAHAVNSDHQMLVLEHSHKVIKENNIKLIVIDSITAHFRSEYPGREMLASRQQQLSGHLRLLHKIVRISGGVGIVTSQAVGNPNSSFMGPAPPTFAGGHVLGHGTAYILNLWKPPGMSEKRFVTLQKSSHLPDRKIQLSIGNDGFCEPEEKKKE